MTTIEQQMRGARGTRRGLHTLSAPLKLLQGVLVDYQVSRDYRRIQGPLVQRRLRLIYEQNEHVMRFAKELLAGEPPVVELRGDPHARRDLARWYLRLILKGVFSELTATNSAQEG